MKTTFLLLLVVVVATLMLQSICTYTSANFWATISF
jgi:hypothetical protein